MGHTGTDEYPMGINYILAIAIDQYDSQGLPGLGHAVAHVDELVRVLTEKYQFEPEHVFRLYNKAAAEELVDRKFMEIKHLLREEDSLVVLYAGHSFFRQQLNESYWIPADGKKDSIASCISNTALSIFLQQIKARHILLVAEACLSSEIKLHLEQFTEETGLSTRHILASGKASLPPAEMPSGAGGFLRAAAACLSENEAEEMSIAEMGACLRERSGFEGLFFFQLKQRDWGIRRKFREDLYWKEIVERGDRKAYREYLEKFPEGKYSSEAHQSLSSIAAARAWNKALEADTVNEYENFLLFHPHSEFVGQARERIETLKQQLRTLNRGNAFNDGQKEVKTSSRRGPSAGHSDNPDIARKILLREEETGPARKKIVVNKRGPNSPAEKKSARKAIRILGRSKAKRNAAGELSPDREKEEMGKVLCKIPAQMCLNEGHTCEIRIAAVSFDESAFTAGLKDIPEAKRGLIKISKIMRVELIGLGGGENFKITALSPDAQPIEQNDFTFWKFIVVPLRAGRHELVVKVTAILNLGEYGEKEKSRLVWNKKIKVESGVQAVEGGFDWVGRYPEMRLDKIALKQKIGENKRMEAIKELEAFFQGTDVRLFNQLILVKSKMKTSKAYFEKGLIDGESYQHALARVDYALLSLIDNIEYQEEAVGLTGLDEDGGSRELDQLYASLEEMAGGRRDS